MKILFCVKGKKITRVQALFLINVHRSASEMMLLSTQFVPWNQSAYLHHVYSIKLGVVNFSGSVLALSK